MWTLRTLSAFALALATVSGCAVDSEYTSDEDAEDTGDALTRELGFADANTLLSDIDMEGDQDLTVADVQAVLEAKKSKLATYTVNGRKASAIIAEEALKNGISPLFVVSRIQVEQGLITSSARWDNVDAAMGYNCHDGKKCAAADKGFDKQLINGCKSLRNYLENIRAGRHAAMGTPLRASDVNAYGIGRTTKTIDPLSTGGVGCKVTPTNAATAAVYTYTPYVGAGVTSVCKSTESGGFGLQLRVLANARKWFAAVPKS